MSSELPARSGEQVPSRVRAREDYQSFVVTNPNVPSRVRARERFQAVPKWNRLVPSRVRARERPSQKSDEATPDGAHRVRARELHASSTRQARVVPIAYAPATLALQDFPQPAHAGFLASGTPCPATNHCHRPPAQHKKHKIFATGEIFFQKAR